MASRSPLIAPFALCLICCLYFSVSGRPLGSSRFLAQSDVALDALLASTSASCAENPSAAGCAAGAAVDSEADDNLRGGGGGHGGGGGRGGGARGIGYHFGGGGGSNTPSPPSEGGGGRSCFPGNALVQLADGRLKAMRDLAVGETVAIQTADSTLGFEDVYAFGHFDPSVVSQFVRITSAPAARFGTPFAATGNTSRTLRLTADHFLPTSTSTGQVFKRARDIEVGDLVFAVNACSPSLSAYIVTGAWRSACAAEVSKTIEAGLFAPMTMGGTIIVDGVAASVHSDWFLDGVMDALRLTAYLPHIYQGILAPFRLPYKLLPKEAYIAGYKALDSASGGIANVGNDHGGAIFAASSVASLAFAAMLGFAARRSAAKLGL